MLKFLLPHWIHNMKHAFMKFVLRTRSLWNALSAGNRLDIGQRHVGELRTVLERNTSSCNNTHCCHCTKKGYFLFHGYSF